MWVVCFVARIISWTDDLSRESRERENAFLAFTSSAHRIISLFVFFFARGFTLQSRDYHITIDHGRYQPAPSLPPQLPPSYYVMAVDSDIYQRMFDEVSESMRMPCGLFYFGHHADVEYPSIAIAIVGVAVVFSLMLWATIYVDG